MNTKARWIEGTMNALEGITRAELDPSIHMSLEEAIAMDKPKNPVFQKSLIWKLAASIALLVTFNFLTIFYLNKTKNTKQQMKTSFSAEYFFYIDDYNL